MFDLFKIISMVALLDYIIYSYYKKIYNVKLNNDNYKYRIIIFSIFWFLILFTFRYNLINFEKRNYYFLFTSVVTFILYLLFNIYNKYNFNCSIKFMCADIVYGIIISNIVVLISFLI